MDKDKTTEYSIDVSMNPHYHDNKECPYFWYIVGHDNNGSYNRGSGWSKTPEEAWKEANVYYERFIVTGS